MAHLSQRPHVLIVFADQLCAQTTGSAGDPNACTSGLDRLVGESLNLTHAVSRHPVCCAYRASLMTGQYPLIYGVYVNAVPLGDGHVLIAQAFAVQDYATGYTGKWHLYGSPDGAYGRHAACIPPQSQQGFDTWKAFGCSYRYHTSPCFADDFREPRLGDGYDAVAQTEEACRYISDHGDQQPFFLMLFSGPPHAPYDEAPADCLARFRDREIRLRPNVPAAQRAVAIRTLHRYYAHIAALDGCVAALLGGLEERGITEDTRLVFTADHGDMHFSQGLQAKHCPWDESSRVPFLLRCPRCLGHQGRCGDLLLEAPDTMPTLLGLVVWAEGALDGGEARSHAAAVRPGRSPRTLLGLSVGASQLRYAAHPEITGLPWRAYPRHIYVRNIQGPWLLYDHEADPHQRPTSSVTDSVTIGRLPTPGGCSPRSVDNPVTVAG